LGTRHLTSKIRLKTRMFIQDLGLGHFELGHTSAFNKTTKLVQQQSEMNEMSLPPLPPLSAAKKGKTSENSDQRP